jgi:hypothetical protein
VYNDVDGDDDSNSNSNGNNNNIMCTSSAEAATVTSSAERMRHPVSAVHTPPNQLRVETNRAPPPPLLLLPPVVLVHIAVRIIPSAAPRGRHDHRECVRCVRTCVRVRECVFFFFFIYFFAVHSYFSAPASVFAVHKCAGEKSIIFFF